MSKDYNKDFINSINMAKYIEKAGNRKIIIWGAGAIGKKVYEILIENNLPVYSFIDGNAENMNFEFCGVKVQTSEILNNKEKYYIIVAMLNYNEGINNFLQGKNYEEVKDYLYIFHKPLVVEKDEEYIDIYGNKICGKKGTKFNIVAYDSELNLYSESVASSTKIFSGNSKINLGKECNIKDGVIIYCYNKSEFNLSDSGDIHIGEGSEILCFNHSKLEIGSSSCIKEKAYIVCYDDSEFKIGPGCHFDEKALLRCCNNSKFSIGTECYFNEGAIIECKENSILNIGDGCRLGKDTTMASDFSGTLNLGKEVMSSVNVSIFNNDAHPIFDIDTNTQINRNNTTTIKDHVWLGIKATVLTGSEIGEGCIVGANSVVTKKFSNNCTIAGVPAKVLRENVGWDLDETNIELINKKYFNKTR